MHISGLDLFGLLAVTMMLVCYAFEGRAAWVTLAFAASCAASSVYGFLQGAWPIGIVEGIWAVVALNKWRLRILPLWRSPDGVPGKTGEP